MSWEKVVETTESGEQVWYLSEKGNVFQASESNFFVMIPKIIKLGPFKTLEEAEQNVDNGEYSSLVESMVQELNIQITAKSKGQ